MSESSLHSKQAALFVSLASMFIIGGIVVLLGFHLNTSNMQHVSPLNSGALIAACPETACTQDLLRGMMEQDAQLLRSERVRNAINSRMAIFVIAEIVALLLVALGSVLIFDRIKSDVADTLTYETLTFKTAWPGVTLCFFGSAILGFALFQTTTTGYRIMVTDDPVFVEDMNVFASPNTQWSNITPTGGNDFVAQGPVLIDDFPPPQEEQEQ